MSPRFNSERVVCPDKCFLTVCFFFQVESSRFSKQQNKLVLTLNSFRNGALFGISLEVIEALSSPLAKCRKSRVQSFLGEKISPWNGTCSLNCSDQPVTKFSYPWCSASSAINSKCGYFLNSIRQAKRLISLIQLKSLFSGKGIFFIFHIHPSRSSEDM